MKKFTSLVITLIFAYTVLSGFTPVRENSLQIGNTEWKLQSAVIANESYGSKSKFELDIISDNEAVDKAKTFVYFSITGTASTTLADGSYQLSDDKLDNRKPFQFSGSVQLNGNMVKIKNGTFSIENTRGSAIIHFILKLENGDVANGSYSGKISFIDRSTNYD